ncbi:D(4) dopamine receptor [Tachyglossus aculeatus]|uniref:D(4) dopamine receptor n=1 Tax=Tachyglossus aculeatus TaxID=9261 RepID=UPI0018F56140|nr:D(4) dopamine receptor [Tachyglossus aculeatus]
MASEWTSGRRTGKGREEPGRAGKSREPGAGEELGPVGRGRRGSRGKWEGGSGSPGAGGALLAGGLLIAWVLSGNALVCASVASERALRTPTNRFIVSLALADLLLALLVLPLFVYSQFQGGVWTLSTWLCDALMAMDVMLCTASIFNLCAISVDRFIAVSVPLNYNRRQMDGRQAVLLGTPWALSLAVAAPVLLGLNDRAGRDPRRCQLEDRDYVIYSSVCSFFVPCPLLLLLYCAMFRGLRRWEEARRAKLRSGLGASRRPGHPPPASPIRTVCRPAPTPGKRAKITRRERKAMRVLPVVVGAFLLCWTPFFVVHITRVLCVSCTIPGQLVSTVTWLGYVNSALNPIIYTVFNAEFRNYFRRALRLSC